MRILHWDELDDELRAEATLVDWSDGNPPYLTGLLHEPWQNGRPCQEYTSLLAVEGRRVLARVGFLRMSFRDPEGAEPVLGIGDVITNPRDLRQGLATRLIEEVHALARSEGLRLSFLGTRVSWGAHRGYEKLGYRDVYSPPRSLRWVPSAGGRALRGGFSVRKARRTDGPALQQVLDRASEGRPGLLPRAEGWFAARLRLHWNRPGDYLLLWKGGKVVGYAAVLPGFRQITCAEAVPISPSFGRPLLDAIERRAAGRWLAFGTTTFPRDMAAEFRRRGYHQIDRAHMVLMACGLGPGGTAAVRRARTVFRDPRLFCHQPDTI